MTYVFVSFSNYKGKNLGCCIVQVDTQENVNDVCDELGLTPPKPNDVRGYVLETEEDFRSQEMDLNKFYTRSEMIKKEFRPTKS